jgi:two-component system NarL family sensor kinase
MSVTSQVFWIFVVAVGTAALVTALLLTAVVQQQRRFLSITRNQNQRLLAAQEEERAWVARELHDGVIQHVAIVAAEISEMETRWVGDVERMSQRLEGVRAELDALAQEVRRVAHHLHPTVLDQLGIHAALQSLGSEMKQTHGLTVDLQLAAAPPALPQRSAGALYRVAQEALRNVARHSGVREAHLALTPDDSGVTLLVRDNGRGFDPRSGASRSGLGVTSMTERMALLGGKLSVSSAPGRGTRVSAWVPLT